jgi:hypothetical protein
MPAGSTYTPIATTTISGTSTNQVTFSSLASTYTDIIAIVNGGVTSGNINLLARFNSDSGTNYSYTSLDGNGSAASSARTSNSNYLNLNYYGYMTADMNTNYVVNFMNYSNATTNKTVIARANNAGNGTNAIVNLWRSTAAVNRIDFYTSANNFANGTTFTLYGIAAA